MKHGNEEKKSRPTSFEKIVQLIWFEKWMMYLLFEHNGSSLVNVSISGIGVTLKGPE